MRNKTRHHRLTFTAIVAGVLLVTTVCSSDVLAQTSPDVSWEEPHGRGVDLYRQANYSSAITEFERAQQLGAPAANLYNLARCYERLGRVSEAIRTYDQYLSASAISPERRVRATELRSELVSAHGLLRITSDPSGAEVLLDGAAAVPLRVTPAEVWLQPGAHRLEVRLEGRQNAIRQIIIEAGGEHALEITLEQASETVVEPDTEEIALNSTSDEADDDRASGSPWPWVVLGVGAALSVVGLALDLTAYRQAQSATSPFGDMSELIEWESTIYDTATAGDVLLFTGMAIFVGALVWALVARSRRARREADVQPSIIEEPDATASEGP